MGLQALAAALIFVVASCGRASALDGGGVTTKSHHARFALPCGPRSLSNEARKRTASPVSGRDRLELSAYATDAPMLFRSRTKSPRLVTFFVNSSDEIVVSLALVDGALPINANYRLKGGYINAGLSRAEIALVHSLKSYLRPVKTDGSARNPPRRMTVFARVVVDRNVTRSTFGRVLDAAGAARNATDRFDGELFPGGAADGAFLYRQTRLADVLPKGIVADYISFSAFRESSKALSIIIDEPLGISLSERGRLSALASSAANGDRSRCKRMRRVKNEIDPVTFWEKLAQMLGFENRMAKRRTRINFGSPSATYEGSTNVENSVEVSNENTADAGDAKGDLSVQQGDHSAEGGTGDAAPSIGQGGQGSNAKGGPAEGGKSYGEGAAGNQGGTGGNGTGIGTGTGYGEGGQGGQGGLGGHGGTGGNLNYHAGAGSSGDGPPRQGPSAADGKGVTIAVCWPLIAIALLFH